MSKLFVGLVQSERGQTGAEKTVGVHRATAIV